MVITRPGKPMVKKIIGFHTMTWKMEIRMNYRGLQLINFWLQEAFTRAFIQHYSRISVALVGSGDRQTISNRVVHVSVQLLSPEGLACKMVENHNLLYIMLISLNSMLQRVLTSSDMNGNINIIVVQIRPLL